MTLSHARPLTLVTATVVGVVQLVLTPFHRLDHFERSNRKGASCAQDSGLDSTRGIDGRNPLRKWPGQQTQGQHDPSIVPQLNFVRAYNARSLSNRPRA